MKIRVLGCSGGIGGRHLRTTSTSGRQRHPDRCRYRRWRSSIAELVQIDHLFLTHSHLDHIACLPLMVDTVGEMRNRPLIVHATAETLEIVHSHLLNWATWPDFTQIPSKEAPFIRFEEMLVGETVEINGRRIIALPADHTVPAVGYQLDSGRSSLVFSGDTGPCRALWDAVNRISNLRHLIIECAFSNREHALALRSKHLCPSLLMEELSQLQRACEIYITHLKPGQIELTMQELEDCVGEFRPNMLQNNQLFDL